MAFSTRRGRPCSAHKKQQDPGTPELQVKRLQHATSEPLDLLYRQQHISPAEHRAGIHFRWLYTLCYGVPLPNPRDITGAADTLVREDEPLWREEREAEYREAAAALQSAKRLNCVLDCCLFQELPPGKLEMIRLREGLDILMAIWRVK